MQSVKTSASKNYQDYLNIALNDVGYNVQKNDEKVGNQN